MPKKTTSRERSKWAELQNINLIPALMMICEKIRYLHTRNLWKGTTKDLYGEAKTNLGQYLQYLEWNFGLFTFPWFLALFWNIYLVWEFQKNALLWQYQNSPSEWKSMWKCVIYVAKHNSKLTRKNGIFFREMIFNFHQKISLLFNNHPKLA